MNIKDIWHQKKSKFTIVADYGKPYDIKVDSEKQLKKELKNLKEIHDEEEHPYFDIWIYDENDNDITDDIVKKYKKYFG